MRLRARLSFLGFSVLLLLGAVGKAQAQSPVTLSGGCPLSNPLYKDLRSAAAALEKRVNLPASCDELQKKLEEASKQVKTAADALTRIPVDFGNEKVTRSLAQGTLPDGSVELRQAVSGIVDIGNVVSRLGGDDRCGRALLSRSDWLEALVDTVNSLMPYVLLVGGRSPQTTTLVLTATAVGSSVKTFLTLHRNNSFDMRQSSQRQTFIENACAFYEYNDAVRGLVRARSGEVSEVDERVKELQLALERLDAKKPSLPEPAREILELDLSLKKDRSRLGELEGTVARLAEIESFACHVVRTEVEQSVAGNGWSFALAAADRLDFLLKESAAQGQDVAGRRLLTTFARGISTDPSLYQDAGAGKCLKRAREWFSVMKQVLDATDQELGRPGRRDLGGRDEFKARAAWEEQRRGAQATLDLAKARQRFLSALANQGEQLEMSELLDTRDGIYRGLFADETRNLIGIRVKRKSPAESWLEHKWRQSRAKLLEFDKMAQPMDESWLQTVSRFDKTELAAADRARRCAEVESALLTWTTALRHAEASRLFCDTFSTTLTVSNAPGVFGYCQGKFDKNGQNLAAGFVVRQETEVRSREARAREFNSWLIRNKCEKVSGALPKALP